MAPRRSRVGPRTLHSPRFDISDRFDLTPLSATIGAVVNGLDISEPCDGELCEQLLVALHEWKVLFLRGQDLTIEQHAAFASMFGELTDDTLLATSSPDPVDNVVVFTRDAETVGLENEWHADGTFRPVPTAVTILRAIEVPPVGGDTLFADMAAAYDNLGDDVRNRINHLRAVHDWSIGAYAAKYGDHVDELRRELPPVTQPVVIAHPATGRATLFVNRLFTRSIVGLEPDESDELLEILFDQVNLPELQVRWHWQTGSIAMWDNLACQHYGANDYYPQRRVMARTTMFSRSLDRLAAHESSLS